MKKDDVRIGAHYVAKVSGALTLIKIKSAAMAGGWVAESRYTGRLIRVRGAQRLRREVSGEDLVKWDNIQLALRRKKPDDMGSCPVKEEVKR